MKHKVTSSILSVVLLLSVLFAFPTSARADSIDVLGLDTGAEYYIKNSSTGKYLDIDNAIVANNRNVLEYSFNGNTNQRWKIYRVSTGNYRIASSMNTDYCLHIASSGNAVIYKYASSSNEKFAFSRTGSGTYNIKNSNKYVSVSNSNVQTMTSYPTGTWSFEKVKLGKISMFSFQYSGYDSTTENTYIINNLSNINYQNVYSYVNNSRDYAFRQMPLSDIWIHNGHGATGLMHFTSDGSNGGNIDIIKINNLNNNALSSERAIITTGCKSGGNVYSTVANENNNLIEAMYEKGAHFAIGWEDEILNYNASAWLRFFTQHARGENSIRDCIIYANHFMALGNYHYAGDTFQVLSR